jgi:Fe-S cluster assembly protein SufD
MSVSSAIKQSRENREDWKYTDISELEKTVLIKAVAGKEISLRAKDPPGAEIAFIDGEWDGQKSGLSNLPENAFRKIEAGEYLLEIPDRTCLAATPLELRFFGSTQKSPAEATTKIRIVLGANSRLTLLERHETAPQEGIYAHALETEITLKESAKLLHGKIICAGASVHLSKLSAMVEKGAFYDNFTLICGGKTARCELEADLSGENAQCGFSGAMLLRGKDHADIFTRVLHRAAGCSSRQIYKNAVDENASGAFQGKITVAQGAAKADGQQLCKTLLLSDSAEMNAKPELEINNDDVKCSHGCAVGALDEEAVFYLRSRGVSAEDAKNMLIEAFANETAAQISSEEIRAAVEHEIGIWLAKGG